MPDPCGRRACAVDSYEALSDLAAVVDEPDEHRARLQELTAAEELLPSLEQEAPEIPHREPSSRGSKLARRHRYLNAT